MSLLVQWGWTRWSLKVPSNPNYSMIFPSAWDTCLRYWSCLFSMLHPSLHRECPSVGPSCSAHRGAGVDLRTTHIHSAAGLCSLKCGRPRGGAHLSHTLTRNMCLWRTWIPDPNPLKQKWKGLKHTHRSETLLSPTLWWAYNQELYPLFIFPVNLQSTLQLSFFWMWISDSSRHAWVKPIMSCVWSRSLPHVIIDSIVLRC